MIGMVIVGSGRQDDVSLPFADPSDDLTADLQAGHQFAVMIIEYFILDTDSAPGFQGFGAPAFRENATALLMVPDIAIRNRNELDFVSGRHILCRQSASLEVTIVWMRAKSNHSKARVVLTQH
jgi:hypothetical protein